VSVVRTTVRRVDAAAHRVECEDGSTYPFDKCLVATGAVPKLVLHHPNVVGIRDTEVWRGIVALAKDVDRVWR
jgi:NADPH-dependent 2,4-dienoyl-CoA reductase/sulfur reductase-like enzyme